MVELNPELITRSAPVAAQPDKLDVTGQIPKTVAETGLVNANTKNVEAQTTGVNIENAIKQQNLFGTQALGTTMQALRNMPAPTNKDGSTNVVPAGVDPTWKVKNGRYVDSDGGLVNPQVAPMRNPDKSLNPFSNQTLDATMSGLAAHGASPMFQQQYYTNTLKTNSEAAKSAMETFKAQQESETSAANAKSIAQKSSANIAYTIQTPEQMHQYVLGHPEAVQMWGLDPSKSLEDNFAQVQHIAKASDYAANVAGTGQKSVETTLAPIKVAIEKVNSDISQGKLTKEKGDMVIEATKNSMPVQGLIRQASNTQGLANTIQYLVDNGYNTTTSAAVKDIPLASIRNFINTQGLVRDGKVDFQSVVAMYNDQIGAVDAATQTLEGVKGSMGSDSRAEMMKAGAGSIGAGDNNATVNLKLQVGKKYLQNAEDSAKHVVDSYNKGLDAANIDKKYHIEIPTYKVPLYDTSGKSNNSETKTNEGDKTLSLTDAKAYAQKHSITTQTAVDLLIKNGYKVK